jgi:hypothetical protein
MGNLGEQVMHHVRANVVVDLQGGQHEGQQWAERALPFCDLGAAACTLQGAGHWREGGKGPQQPTAQLDHSWAAKANACRQFILASPSWEEAGRQAGILSPVPTAKMNLHAPC